MKTFQITQNFGKGSFCYIYFEVEDKTEENEIKEKAILIQKKEYEERMSGFFGKVREKPKILIKEYCKETHKIKEEGISISARWR